MIYEDAGGKLWELVCRSTDANNQNAMVTLRGEDGTLRHFAATAISGATPDFKPATAKSAASDSALTDALKETLQNIRLMSSIRFIAMPLFLTGTAALAKTYLAPTEERIADHALIPWAGLGLALLFLLIELVLSFNLICFWRKLRAYGAGRPWDATYAHRNELALWLARLALFAPYPIGAAYWLSKLGPPALALAVPAALSLTATAAWAWASYRA